MKLFIKKETILVSAFVLVSSVATAAQAYKSMPPKFSYEQNAENVLREYPLGKINMSEAFSHHGAPVRKLILPNGKKGWLYSTGRDLRESDIRNSTYVCILGQDVVEKIFPNMNPLGQTVRVDGKPLRVIGVFERQPTMNTNIS